MKQLIIIPTHKEYAFFLDACARHGLLIQEAVIGKLPVVRLPELNMTGARGGLGKVQFAVHTQHLLDLEPDWDLIICAGAAGGLIKGLAVGDIVVATETVEHDINNYFGEPLMPRFSGDAETLAAMRKLATGSGLPLRFEPVASGDEDIIGIERQQAIREATGAIAVAWEGAGGARACQLSGAPYLEIRCISDGADGEAASDYFFNLEDVMQRIAELLFLFARK